MHYFMRLHRSSFCVVGSKASITARSGQELRNSLVCVEWAAYPPSNIFSHLCRRCAGWGGRVKCLCAWLQNNDFSIYIISVNIVDSDSDGSICGCGDGFYIFAWCCGCFTAPCTGCRESCGRLHDFGNRCTASRCSQNDFRNFGALCVILICRQSHSSQNTNNRHNDHQFDQGETLLDRTLHNKLLVKK